MIRAVEGPIASVRGVRPDELEYTGSAEPLRDVWLDLRAALRGVLEHVTLADVAARAAKLVHLRELVPNTVVRAGLT